MQSAASLAPTDRANQQPDPATGDMLATRPHLSMHAVSGLLLGDVPLNAIADTLGTPCWVTGADILRSRYRELPARWRKPGCRYRCITR